VISGARDPDLLIGFGHAALPRGNVWTAFE
jgi:hypothetical protein